MSIAVMSMLSKTCLFEQGKTYPVIMMMADWASDDGGDVYPGVDLLAAKSRTSIRTLQTVLRQLEQDGIISRVANAKGGRGKVTEYKINLERVRELQALHEAQEPDCPWCAAWRRSDEKRVQARAQRVQDRDVKGASRAQKGAKIGGCIEEPPTDPSMNLSEPARARAGEREAALPVEEETTNRWPEVWRALSGWQGLPPSISESEAMDAWLAIAKLPDGPAAGEMVICAHRFGEWLAAENTRRKPSQGPYLTPHPHNWLRKGGWRSFLDDLRNLARTADARKSAEAAMYTRLGDGLAILQRANLSETIISAWFGDATFEPGPIPRFRMGRLVAANWARNNFSDRIERAAGTRIAFEGPRA